MEIIVEQVTTDADVDAFMQIRHQVFLREMGITLPAFGASENGHATYLVARGVADKEPVGSLCVLDTSDEHQLHESFGLKFAPQARVARYTQLAVLKPYRGMNIPLSMMIEAYRRVIIPLQFDYTWLLFDVERAANSFLVNQLGFNALPQTFVSEYGCRCPLVRNERAQESVRCIGVAQLYLEQHRNFYALENAPSVVRAVGA